MMMLTQVNTNWFATAVGHRPIMAAGFPNDDTVPGGAQSAIRVFVVEDEAVISLDLCERLTSLGYVVCGSASRGEVAVEKILEIKPNLVLMDINLAGKISGVEAAERIRAHYRVPVVFLTAYSGSELIARASSSGGYGYLVKPFEERELHATIQVALTRFEYDCRLGEINAILEERVGLRTAELEKALHAAEEANRAKTVFLRNMNHELRTPLHQISLLAELLAATAISADEKAAWCIENIARSGKHLAQLIEQLLDLSAIDARATLPLHVEAVDPSAIVREAIAMVQSLADETGIMLENVTGAAGRLTVLANRDSLRQVVMTLLSNAIRYNRQGGSVRVETCCLDGNMTRISVSDTGLGLTEEQLRSAFDPFVRFVPEGAVIDGLGIGLTVARHLAERMKGRIEASSVPGKGSRFSIVLPSAGSDQPQ